MSRQSQPEITNRATRIIDGKDLSAEQIILALTGKYPQKMTFTEGALNTLAYTGGVIINRASRIRQALTYFMF
jgi:hypothetical protein